VTLQKCNILRFDRKLWFRAVVLNWGLDMLHIADRGSKIFFLESGDAYYEKE